MVDPLCTTYYNYSCILHSHYFGVKKCLAQRFCVAVKKNMFLYQQEGFCVDIHNFSSTIIILGMILRCYTQKCSYINRNDFAYSNATSLLYIWESMAVYLNDAIPLYIGEIQRSMTQNLSYIYGSAFLNSVILSLPDNCRVNNSNTY